MTEYKVSKHTFTSPSKTKTHFHVAALGWHACNFQINPMHFGNFLCTKKL